MNICLVCTDPISIFFDKRILDIATVLKSNANNITIITVGENDSIYSFGAHTVLQRGRKAFAIANRNLLDSIGKLTKINKEFENTKTDEQNLKLLKKYGNILLKNSKILYGIAHSIYSYFQIILRRIRRLRTMIFFVVGNLKARKKRQDFYLRDAETLAGWLANNNFDFLVGCDLPGALACALVVTKNQLFWYDAHEYYSKQKWLENKVDVNYLEKIERKVLEVSDIFSTVSTGLLDEMLRDTSHYDGRKYFLPNSSDPMRLTSDLYPDLREVLKVESNSKIAVFHGVLAGSYRQLTQFALSFSQAEKSDWHLLFIGYSATDTLLAMAKKNQQIHVLNPVSNHKLGSLLKQCEVILMPYEVFDLNTHFGLPNKMGDAVALKIPILYNSKLVEIGKWSSKFNLGLPFDWEEIQNKPNLIVEKLDSLRLMFPDWDGAELNIGWTYFENTINEMLKG